MSLAYHTFTEGNRTNEPIWHDGKWREMRSRAGIESKQLQKEMVKLHKNERRIPFILFTAVHGSFFVILRAMNTYNVCVQQPFKWIFEDDIYEKWKVKPAFFMNQHTHTHAVCNQFSRNETLVSIVLFQEFGCCGPFNFVFIDDKMYEKLNVCCALLCMQC